MIRKPRDTNELAKRRLTITALFCIAACLAALTVLFIILAIYTMDPTKATQDGSMAWLLGILSVIAFCVAGMIYDTL